MNVKWHGESPYLLVWVLYDVKVVTGFIISKGPPTRQFMTTPIVLLIYRDWPLVFESGIYMFNMNQRYNHL